jgi:hypothetical protein
MTPRTALLAVTLCLGLTSAFSLAACGDDESGGGSPPSASEDLIEQADAICEQEDNQIAADRVARFGEDPMGPASKADEEEFVTETVIPAIQAQVDRLSELDVPPVNEEQFDKFLTAVEKGLDEARADPLELTIYGDRARVHPPFEDAIRLADEIGFDDCTEGEPDIPG